MTQQSLLGIYLKKTKALIQKNICIPYVHCIHNSQDMEATQVPINRQVDKKAVVHIYSRILLSHKKSEILLFVTTWMGLEDTVLSKMSQT